MTEEGKKPVTPKRASTVLLTRPSDMGFQVYLIRRSSGSSFMPGNYVFPGGTLERTDWDQGFWLGHSDLALEEMVRNLGGGLPAEELLAFCVAAIRETFEEAGVLLAGRSGQPPEELKEICRLRRKEGLDKGWFRELISQEELSLSLSGLGRWSHWITPEARSHRYDTKFFLAFMPPEQECIPDNLETTHGIWVTPDEGLRGNLRGEIPLSPPALVTLHQLLPCRGMEGLKEEMKGHPWGEPCLSIFRRFPEGQLILLPGDPWFGEEDKIDPVGIKKKGLEPGEPFTRLWCQDGVWRPIAN